jgi:[protein-PII] uridylyltransferase
MLNHLAFRRDNSDQSILIEAASQIGSPANLRMLFVLSCADLAAVGPDVLNPWKIEVLGDLYQRIMETLSGGAAVADFDQRFAPQRERLLETARTLDDADWLSRQIESLPPAYLRAASVETVLDDLQRLRSLPSHKSLAWGRYLPSQDIAEYSVGAEETIADGIFHRLTGAITSQGLQILSAEIHSLADTLFLDKFYVRDPDFKGEPPAHRFEAVSRALIDSLRGDVHELPAFRRVWQGHRDSNNMLVALPAQIRIDNTTSDRFTILDVFAHDRPGLLYTIAKSLFDERLSVRIAKIGTYLDQVVDVFYVTDAQGHKVEDELRLAEIRSRLYHAIQSWEEQTA